MKSKDQVAITVLVGKARHVELTLEAKRLGQSLADYMRVAAFERLDTHKAKRDREIAG